MRRRAFLQLSCAALSWPTSVIAQSADLPVVGFLSLAEPDAFAHLLSAYLEGLRSAGFVEGGNVVIEYRWARGKYDRLPALAAELVSLDVAVIVSSGGDRPSLAAKAETTTIPIVFVGSDDPVGLGLVESLSHPSGNMTGASLFTSELEVKKLELLNEVLATAHSIGMLINPGNPAAERDAMKVEAAARERGQKLTIAGATSESEIDSAFVLFGRHKLDGLLVGHDPFFNSRRDQIVAHVAQLSVPAIYEHREFVTAGGLMSYGNDIAENYRIAGTYTARILNGSKPAELPVQQATKFSLVVNLRTAEALNLEFPSVILVRADEVVE